MTIASMRYAYPLNEGGSEYTCGEFVWTIVCGPDGWEITAEGWEDVDQPVRVVRCGYETAEAAEFELLTNAGGLYRGDGSPTP